MNSSRPFPHLIRRLLAMAVWTAASGEHSATAQTVKPDGSDAHPSDYRHPVLTWTQQEAVPLTTPTRDRQAPADDVMGKLQSIIIPQAEFRATPLRDVVEFLHREGRRRDPEPDPDKRGVNIFVEFPTPVIPNLEPVIPGLPSDPTPAPGATPKVTVNEETRVTLTMSNLPLLEALKYVAKQVGLAVKVETDAVYIVPTDSRHFMITAEYHVLLTWRDNSLQLNTPPLGDDKSSGEVVRGNGYEKSWLESQGVAFPPGASATYLPRAHRLLVRNTQENIDKVAALISSALKTPAPTPANP